MQKKAVLVLGNLKRKSFQWHNKVLSVCVCGGGVGRGAGCVYIAELQKIQIFYFYQDFCNFDLK